MNLLTITTENKTALNRVYNMTVGRTIMLQLPELLEQHLSIYDTNFAEVEIKQRPNHKGDISHSLSSVKKAERLLVFKPTHNINKFIEEKVEW